MRHRIMTAALALLLFSAAGCAYFNTFYNARRSYKQALEIASENPENPTSGEETLLDEAVVGAGKVLAEHPDSRWADDAQLLMGDALLQLGTRSVSGSGRSDLEEALLAYSSVLVITESPEIADRARLGMGRAALELGRYYDAAASFQSVSEEDRRLFRRSGRICESSSSHQRISPASSNASSRHAVWVSTEASASNSSAWASSSSAR